MSRLAPTKEITMTALRVSVLAFALSFTSAALAETSTGKDPANKTAPSKDTPAAPGKSVKKPGATKDPAQPAPSK
jgi:hypothetical protein